VLAALLKSYSDTLSNRSCNDFDLAREVPGLTKEEWEEVRKAYKAFQDGDEDEAPPRILLDWLLADLCVVLLEKE
jgi:hypothetical protein